MFNQYQPNIENLHQYMQQENERQQSGDGPNWWSFPPGMSVIRILPPWDPTGRIALPVFMHPIEFQGKGMSYKKYNWTCVNKTFNKPCPICEGLAGLAASGIDISNWEANRRQFYFNAIVMHDPTFDQKGKGTAPGTHVLLKAPKTFYDWVIAQITNTMIGDITSISNGIDVYVTKEGTGLGTSYNMTLSPNGRTAVPQEYLDKIKDLYILDDIFSAGFDQEQINELVDHLRRSAGAFNNAIPNVQQQMAGYQQPINPTVPPQSTGYPPMNNPVSSAPSQFTAPQAQAPTGMPPMAASPYAQPASTPVNFPQAGSIPSMTVTSPSNSQPAPAEAQSNLPKCYGNYDNGNVNCVVCPVEVQCSQSKNK